MRHFYFRLTLGIVWLAAALFCIASADLPFAALYAVLGVLFLWSARLIRKKEEKDNDDRE